MTYRNPHGLSPTARAALPYYQASAHQASAPPDLLRHPQPTTAPHVLQTLQALPYRRWQRAVPVVARGGALCALTGEVWLERGLAPEILGRILAHELVHWAGLWLRSGFMRSLVGRWRPPTYRLVQEELTAELGASKLCAMLGAPTAPASTGACLAYQHYNRMSPMVGFVENAYVLADVDSDESVTFIMDLLACPERAYILPVPTHTCVCQPIQPRDAPRIMEAA